jgi:short-subunit dehydrogenase
MKLLTRSAVIFGAIAGTGALAAARRRRRSRLSLQGKVVLITGASHGLGLALARQFAQEGSRIVLCARDENQLQLARRDLQRFSEEEAFTVACDVSDSSQVGHLVASALDRFGRIDVLVNNAGMIQVGPIHTMTVKDFEKAMGVMFWGTVYTTLAVLPHMRYRGQGRIVNITSVGAKVSVPHLVPYSCAKFACAGFSEGMRAELRGTGVKVVTIAPGLMRTGSHLNAIFNGAERGEAVWFSLGASLPAISMSAEKAARQIVAATARGTSERILGMPAKTISWFHGLFPGITADMMGLMGMAMPRGGRHTERGADSAILKTAPMRALTALGRRAAWRLLQPDAGRAT